MSALERIAALHTPGRTAESAEGIVEGHRVARPMSQYTCNVCAGNDYDDSGALWPCETWVYASQTVAVAETWAKLMADARWCGDPLELIRTAIALNRD